MPLPGGTVILMGKKDKQTRQKVDTSPSRSPVHSRQQQQQPTSTSAASISASIASSSASSLSASGHSPRAPTKSTGDSSKSHLQASIRSQPDDTTTGISESFASKTAKK